MTQKTMRALVGGAGPDWAMRDVDVPTPGPRHVLVRVRAAGLNRADLYMLQGTYTPGGKLPQLFTAGLELAGEVEAVGAEVDRVRVGERVMGLTVGSFADFALADPRQLIPIPPSLSWTDAGALPVGLATEHDALVTQAGLVAGQRVLVTGASSGVGVLAVQLAKVLGAGLVIATTTSASKVGALKHVGADVVIDTKTENVAEAIRNVAVEGVDIVLDHVGGQLLADLLTATRIGGSIINIGRLGGAKSTIDLEQLALRRLKVNGTTFRTRTSAERGEVCAAVVRDTLPALAAGRIRPLVDSVFAFADAARAAERMRSNQAAGKIVLQM